MTIASKGELVTCDAGNHPMFRLARDIDATTVPRHRDFEPIRDDLGPLLDGLRIPSCTCGGKGFGLTKYGMRIHFADGWRPKA